MNSQDIQQAYAKLIINDQSLLEDSIEQRQQNDANQSPYNIQNANKPNIQVPQYQLYPIQPFQINHPIQHNQVHPDPAMIIAQNDEGGINDSNRKFALTITSIWAAQMFADYFILYFLQFWRTPKFFCIISVAVSIAIPFYAYKLKETPSKQTQMILFAVQILASSLSQIGYLSIFDLLLGRNHLFDMFFFEIFQAAVMIGAFIQIFAQQKPNAINISISSSIIMLFVVLKWLGYFQSMFYIPVFICCILSYMLVFALESVYDGSNKIIKKDQILIAFLQFKVLFFIPCIKE